MVLTRLRQRPEVLAIAASVILCAGQRVCLKTLMLLSALRQRAMMRCRRLLTLVERLALRESVRRRRQGGGERHLSMGADFGVAVHVRTLLIMSESTVVLTATSLQALAGGGARFRGAAAEERAAVTLPALPKPVSMGSRLQVLPSLGQRLFAGIPPTSFVTPLRESRRKKSEQESRQSASGMLWQLKLRADVRGLKAFQWQPRPKPGVFRERGKLDS